MIQYSKKFTLFYYSVQLCSCINAETIYHLGLAARLAVQAGAAGIIVSNHGARQLDYVPATISALEEVYDLFLTVLVLLLFLLPVLCLLLGASTHILIFSVHAVVPGCERCTRQDPRILGWRCPPWNRCL